MVEHNVSNIQTQKIENTALENNCAAVLSIADTVRTTLGPKGLDKLLVDELGNRFITNDGATIMLSIKTIHPVAKMVVEIADRQEAKSGDGTTTAVVLAAEMLKEGKRLITDMGIHPTLIVRGMEIGIQRSIELLKQMAVKIDIEDAGILFISSPQADELLLSNLLIKNILPIHVSNEELLTIAYAFDMQVIRRKEDIERGSVVTIKSMRYDEEKGLFFFENLAQRNVVTVIIGGATKVTSQERWRSVKDGISAAQSALNDGIVAGGGAVELCISEKLKEKSLNGGVESLGIEVVAHALSGIMRQILTNAGFSAFEKMTEIRNKSGEYGINVNTGKIENMLEAGVIDSAGIKINALKSAAEIVKAVLRIDRILIAHSPHNAVVGKSANEPNLKG